MTGTQTTKTNYYLKGLVLVVAALFLALLALSGPALGKQSYTKSDTSHHQSALAADNKDGAAAIQSVATAPKASFASGTGANFFGVKVSDHGNLMSFESPQGQEMVFDEREGYAVCTQFNLPGGGIQTTVHGHDTGSVESGFGPPTFSQPKAGRFPLTVTRKTTDGQFKLKQVWAKPDPVEKDVTVTMTLTNLSSAPVTKVLLSRSGDFDVGNSADQGASSTSSAWQWDDRSRSASETPSGIMLSDLGNLPPGSVQGAAIETQLEWVNSTRTTCINNPAPTPTSVQDLAMRNLYQLGDFNGGQSKTVKFEYGRM